MSEKLSLNHLSNNHEANGFAYSQQEVKVGRHERKMWRERAKKMRKFGRSAIDNAMDMVTGRSFSAYRASKGAERQWQRAEQAQREADAQQAFRQDQIRRMRVFQDQQRDGGMTAEQAALNNKPVNGRRVDDIRFLAPGAKEALASPLQTRPGERRRQPAGEQHPQTTPSDLAAVRQRDVGAGDFNQDVKIFRGLPPHSRAVGRASVPAENLSNPHAEQRARRREVDEAVRRAVFEPAAPDFDAIVDHADDLNKHDAPDGFSGPYVQYREPQPRVDLPNFMPEEYEAAQKKLEEVKALIRAEDEGVPEAHVPADEQLRPLIYDRAERDLDHQPDYLSDSVMVPTAEDADLGIFHDAVAAHEARHAAARDAEVQGILQAEEDLPAFAEIQDKLGHRPDVRSRPGRHARPDTEHEHDTLEHAGHNQ